MAVPSAASGSTKNGRNPGIPAQYLQQRFVLPCIATKDLYMIACGVNYFHRYWAEAN